MCFLHLERSLKRSIRRAIDLDGYIQHINVNVSQVNLYTTIECNGFLSVPHVLIELNFKLAYTTLICSIDLVWHTCEKFWYVVCNKSTTIFNAHRPNQYLTREVWAFKDILGDIERRSVEYKELESRNNIISHYQNFQIGILCRHPIQDANLMMNCKHELPSSYK